MATWQYNLYLIPRLAVEKRYKPTPTWLSQDAFDEVDWWRKHQPSSPLAPFIGEFLSPREHWDAGIQAWGDESGNSVAVTLRGKDKRVSEISVRFDVQRFSESFVRQIVELGLLCDALLFTEEGLLIAPGEALLTKHLNQSHAMRFVRDPKKFLADLHDKREVA